MEENPRPRDMEDGVWYDLKPPVDICGEIIRHVICEYQVPDHPNQYSLSGVPDGRTKAMAFVLRFGKHGKIKAQRSQQQTQVPNLRLVR